MSAPTPLHIAIQNGNIDIIKSLLADDSGFLHTRNAEGQTPLELATALNNEEIVHLLLEHGAGHPPQPTIYPTAGYCLDPEQRKKRITFWTIACTIVLVVMTFSAVIYTSIDLLINLQKNTLSHPEIHRAESASLVLAILYLFSIGLPCMVAYLWTYYFFVLRLWEEVPPGIARNTPGTMAGLSIIPVFSWFWMFIALPGLYTDMNKTMEYYGNRTRFGTILIIAACACWLMSDLISMMLSFLAAILGAIGANDAGVLLFVGVSDIFLLVVWCVFTLPMYWLIRNKVFQFIDIKAGLGA